MTRDLRLVMMPGGGACVCHIEGVDQHGRAHLVAAERDPDARWGEGAELVVPEECVERQGWLPMGGER